MATATQLQVVALDDYACGFKNSGACKSLESAGHRVVSVSDALRGEELLQAARDADVLVLTQQRTAMPRSVLEALPRLRWILQTGRNASHIDQEACKEKGIRIFQGSGGNAGPPCEMTWALILGAAKRLSENCSSLRQGAWQRVPCFSLQGKILGVYGLGSIGARVAKVGVAMGMEVLCSGRPGGKSEAAAAAEGLRFVPKEELFQEADVLTIHIKESAQSQGCIGAADLALMKPDAILVNTSQASLIQAGALASALQAGRPGYAALDVFDVEPVPRDDDLLSLSNVLLTPHLGYATVENLEDYYRGVVADFLSELQSS
jgi:D-3-phosphoglycerate dehydrogenase